jgi:hypothetical protein
MTSAPDNSPLYDKVPDDVSKATGAALADLYKAVKTIGFYPEGHPLRTASLRVGMKSLSSVLEGKELTLVVTRAGFSAIEGGAVIDNNPMAQAFARELFLRRIQRLVLLGDLTLDDLGKFLSLLISEPQKFAVAGSLEKEMLRQGIKTIWANEIDISQILAKKEALELAEADPGEHLPDPEDTASPDVPPEESVELSLNEIIALMDEETDDNKYLHWARIVTAKGEELKLAGDFVPLFSAMEALIRQGAAEGRSVTKKEYAVFTMEQLAEGATATYLLQALENKEWPEPERISRIVKQLGIKIVYPIIQRLCIADGLYARKALATALVVIGAPALPPLINMLRDDRWYVVRNMIAIIGEIGNRDTVNALRSSIYHPEQRVRKEAIRSLVKIGGKEAEMLIIDLLEDPDENILRQAILSLGIMKSKLAVPPLLSLVSERDFFLKTIHLKKDAVQALGRIGDKSATSVLVQILESQRWLSWSKWEELKVAAAIALGQMGDEAALPSLKSRADQNNTLGKACSDAVDTIERLAAEIYE